MLNLGAMLSGMSSISTSGLAGAISARRRTGISHGAGFWAIALTFLLVMASGALPTPLYIIYQGRDHLSGLIVTVIFVWVTLETWSGIP